MSRDQAQVKMRYRGYYASTRYGTRWTGNISNDAKARGLLKSSAIEGSFHCWIQPSEHEGSERMSPA